MAVVLQTNPAEQESRKEGGAKDVIQPGAEYEIQHAGYWLQLLAASCSQSVGGLLGSLGSLFSAGTEVAKLSPRVRVLVLPGSKMH